MGQTGFLSKHKMHYGGALLKTRAGRAHGRPIDTRNTMHMVLRSSKAVDEYSFRKPGHARKIKNIINKFSSKYGIQVHSWANVGNHLHFHIRIKNRNTYKPFVRAITSAIAMAVSGVSRWKPSPIGKFWDYRPFTRVIVGFRGLLNIRDYIEINKYEGRGYAKIQARFLLASERRYKKPLGDRR